MNEINFDNHIHTCFCGHADAMTIPVIVETADKLGLERIAIVEHIYSPAELPLIEKIKSQVAGLCHDCKVIVGAEVDVDGKKTDGSLVVENSQLEGIDFIIGAIHYVPGENFYPHSPDDCPLNADELMARWQSSLVGLVSNPIIDVLAHPARLPGVATDMNITFNHILSILEDAAQISAENNIAWEINNLTGAKIQQDFRSHWYLLTQSAIDAGLDITYGSDAHCPEDIAKQDCVQQILAELTDFQGFKAF